MNTIRRSVLSLVTLLAVCLSGLAATPAMADGFIIIHHPHPGPPPWPIPRPEPRPWPHPIQPRVYQFAPLSVEYHKVNITIKDQVAVTEVDQVFHNPNNVQLEGEYVFPLPKGAEIDKFSMDINGKQQEAELLDADKAREIYTSIVRSMKDPALMEYADRGMFKVRIFPIEANGKKQIKIKYTQVLKSDSNLVGYTYPLSTEKFSSTPIKEVGIKCTIESKDPIKTVYSPSHKVEVNRKGEKQAVIGWEVKNAKPDTDFQVFFSTQPENKGEIGVNLLAFNDGDPGNKEGGHFMMFISPGNVADKQVAKKDIVFVLDTSGSMAGDKMEQAKKAIKFCIANLNDGDRFEVVRFATEAEPLFDVLTEANKANRDKATNWVDGLKPLGGTAIEEALTRATKIVTKSTEAGRPSMIIFLTDGRPTIGNTDEKQIVDAVKKEIGDKSVRIFSFGIGTDINTHLLDKITDHTKAASQYVLPTEDIEVKVSSFFTKINYPVLSNVELMVSGDVKVSKMYPSPMPDVFRGDQLIVMGRYTGKADAAPGSSTDAAIQLEGVVNGEKKTFTYEVSFPSKATDNTFVPRLWATRRVGFLLDQIRLSTVDPEVKDEITRLAKQYGIVTPYTSYLILEDEAQRPNRPRLSHGGGGGDPRLDAEMRRQRRAEAGEAFDRFKREEGGEQGVGAAKAADSLKTANNAGDVAEADAAARGGIVRSAPASTPGAPPSVFGGKDDRSLATTGAAAGVESTTTGIHVSRFVAGRTFYFNGTAWVDGLVQDKKTADAKTVKVKFGSDDYFKLLAKHKEAGAWFALGQSVIVLLDGTVYEVTAE